MQGGLVMRKVSVCLSVKRVDCDKTAEKSVQIFISCERSFNLVFWEEWLVRGNPFYLNFGWPGPVEAKLLILNQYSLVAPQP